MFYITARNPSLLMCPAYHKTLQYDRSDYKEIEYQLTSNIQPLRFIYGKTIMDKHYYVFEKVTKSQQLYQKINIKQLIFYPEPPVVFKTTMLQELRYCYASTMPQPELLVFNRHSETLQNIQPAQLISGYVFTVNNYQLVLRRLTDNSGCRYLSRGIDENYIAANSAIMQLQKLQPLTQTIIVDKVERKVVNYVCEQCFYMTRGSIPIYFSQNPQYKPKPKVEIHETNEEDIQKSLEHFQNIISQDLQFVPKASQFKCNVQTFRIIDLLHFNKLSKAYQDLSSDQYVNFNLNKQPQRVLSQFIKKIPEETIPRVNCLDSTDRTNCFATQYFSQFVKDLNLLERLKFRNNCYKAGCVIGRSYTGTVCEKVVQTITGRKNILDKAIDTWIGVIRYMRNRVQGYQKLQKDFWNDEVQFEEAQKNYWHQRAVYELERVVEVVIVVGIALALCHHGKVLLFGLFCAIALMLIALQ
ncbi:Conserved_hypothetical protein [Hexamita inflata]|uniref:SAC domain-containing protein n=1 Tax=Hexamita inflata TaxID=28002 RepID=A0AA86PKX6_9EUKA|nr:Conserved hypothetical protein [Hexamita inflata]